MSSMGRREWLAAVAGLPLLQDSLPQAPPTADPLPYPWVIGQAQDDITDLDNDPVVIAIERRLKCTCGCTLDIYTCRTTDFTCTFSPALHKEVMAMIREGKAPEDIIDFFVEREGPAILMAPPARGFNLVAYLAPGAAVIAGALAITAWLTRQRVAVAAAGMVGTSVSEPESISDAERERLRRALDDVEA
jgi:cytochrome c-type biogenesis protein CcmH